MKSVKLTEQEYLMNAVRRWNNEEEGYYEPSEHELQVARSDLRDLVTRCKRLLPTAKEYEHKYSHWDKLHHAGCAIKRDRPDSACGWLYEMLYFHASGNHNEIDRRILISIIGILEDRFIDCPSPCKAEKDLDTDFFVRKELDFYKNECKSLTEKVRALEAELQAYQTELAAEKTE